MGQIMDYSYSVYKEIDEDMSGEIDYGEFKEWIRNSKDLQEFLLEYTGVQTFESAKRRFDEQVELYQEIFDSMCVEYMSSKYAQTTEVRKVFKLALN